MKAGQLSYVCCVPILELPIFKLWSLLETFLSDELPDRALLSLMLKVLCAVFFLMFGLMW